MKLRERNWKNLYTLFMSTGPWMNIGHPELPQERGLAAPTAHPWLDAAPPYVQVQTQNSSPVVVLDLSPAATSSTDLSPPGHHSNTSNNANNMHVHAPASTDQ